MVGFFGTGKPYNPKVSPKPQNPKALGYAARFEECETGFRVDQDDVCVLP